MADPGEPSPEQDDISFLRTVRMWSVVLIVFSEPRVG